MLFNSIEFLLYFPIVCVVYYLIPSLRWRNLFLLGASYYFYMCWEPVYALLLLSSTVITYVAGLGMERFAEDKCWRKWCMVGSVVLNLAMLLFFKYYNFAAENIKAVMEALGIEMTVPDFEILLPVGISFYIFQALGYSIDVYKHKVKAERDFFTYALFVSFFPQLVAGPIERSKRLLAQFYTKHVFDGERAISGVKIMIWGYFLKLVVADRCAIYVNDVYNSIASHHGYSTLIATVLFTFQIYGDFAGYTFIAIGCAKVMGFTLMENFRRPYLFSTSIQDFWKRNHISLTSWFMDYVYYPLTAYRDTLNWWCLAIFITFLISGLWHGAAWTFVLWGAIHGTMLVLEMLTNKRRRKWEKKHNLAKKEWYIWIQRIIIYCVLCLIIVFFRANSLSDAFTAIGQIFSPSDFTLTSGKSVLVYCAVAIAILFVKEYREEYGIGDDYQDSKGWGWSAFLLSCIFLLGVFDGGQFIYFQF